MSVYDDREDDEIEELAEQFMRDVDEGRSTFMNGDDYEDVINYLLDMREMEYAEAAIKAAIKAYPSDAYFHLLHAKYHSLMMNFAEAQKKLEYVERNFEPLPELFVEKVLVCHALNQPIDAIGALNKALSMDERLPEAHLLLSQEYLIDRNLDKAVEHAVRAIQLDDLSADDLSMMTMDFLPFLLPNKQLITDFFSRLTEEFPMYATLWGGLGLAYMNNNDYDRAIEAFQFQLSLDEENAIAYVNLGDAQFASGDYHSAVRNYTVAMEKSDIPHLPLQIGRCYFQLGDYDAAMASFLQMQDQGLVYDFATVDIVKTFKAQGKFDEARAFLRNLIKENPQNMDALEELIYLLDPAKDADEIRDICFMGMHNEDYPKYAFLHSFVVYCCESGAYDLGIEVCAEYEDDPDLTSMVHYSTAAFYLKKGHIQHACEYLEDALMAAPTDCYADFEELDPSFADVPEVARLLRIYCGDDNKSDSEFPY
jgi:tetratricopeptide (TPR) repeat protein